MYADRVKERSITEGVGAIALDGAETGFQSFVDGIGAGKRVAYTIESADRSQWEVGIGTVSDNSPAPAISRDTVLESSNAGALVNFAAGTKFVFCTAPAGLMMPAADLMSFAAAHG